MARIRTIKPEFFLDEDLGDLDALARLLFIGLWTQADREGRLEDRPRRIKAALLPYDAADVDGLLGLLHDHGFIRRYQVGDLRLIEIPGFRRHQQPHIREAESSLPAPLEPTHGQAPDKHGASTVQAPVEPVGREGKGREGERESGAVAPPSLGPTLGELRELWNEALPHPPFPRWVEVGHDQRKASKRVRERPINGPMGWLALLERIGASSFCRGSNERGWVADPDFLLRVATPRKVFEGKYDDRRPAPANDGPYAFFAEEEAS